MASTIRPHGAWQDAQTLILQLDQAARSGLPARDFYSLVIEQLKHLHLAGELSLWLVDGDCYDHLAGSQSLHPRRVGAGPGGQTHPLQYSLSPRVSMMLVVQTTADDLQATEPEQNPLWDTCHAALELAGQLFLKEHFQKSTSDLVHVDRESLGSPAISAIPLLFAGETATDRLHSIAQATCQAWAADRVVLVRVDKLARMIAHSHLPQFDRHSPAVQSLEQFASLAADAGLPIVYARGVAPADAALTDNASIDIALQSAANDCLNRSNGNALRAESLKLRDGSNCVIIGEWFRPHSAVDPQWSSMVHPVLSDLLSARKPDVIIRLQKWSKLASSRFGLLIASALLFAMMLIPTDFRLTVTGRVVPSVQRSVYSPVDGVIESVLVHDGQSVADGQPLVHVRSRELELREQQLRGDLLTAQAQLASLIASRSRRDVPPTTDVAGDLSMNEEPLKARIAGLESQLEIVEQQKRTLQVVSPICGVVDSWQLKQSLDQRPVTRGQHLLDLYQSDGPWTIVAELPDKYAGYLPPIDQMSPVHFRLTSRPNESHRGKVTRIAKSTAIDATGQSVLPIEAQISRDQPHDFAIGATVWAEIDCGRRPIGFVWLRGLWEWWERQTWY